MTRHPPRTRVPRPIPPLLILSRYRPAGRLPVIAVTTAAGLCLCSATDALARATLAPSLWLLWIAVALVVGPTVYRLCSADASEGERLALVCLLGMALYGFKVMRDPYGLILPDEFFHAFNAQQIVLHHRLFTPDPILPVSSRYPGLEGATSAIMFLTGMSSFGAGLIIIGVARLSLMIALFLLFRSLSGSARVAGLGAALYAGNSNFLLWGAQYSYESLSLPLFVVVIALLVLRSQAAGSERRRLAVPMVVVIVAIAVTHHLTSYLLDCVLVLIAAFPWLTRGRARSLRVWPFAGVSILLTVTWLVVVASETVGYISPLVNQAVSQGLSTLAGESAPRAPFQGGGPGGGTPLPDEAMVYLSILILLVALPFGLRAVWRRHRRDPVALTLCLAAVGFFGVLGLRVSPSAWEIGNRLGEFLFVGIGFVTAYALVDRLPHRRLGRRLPAAVGLAAAVIVVGGAITGWPVDDILAAPTNIDVHGRQVPSQTFAVGSWVHAHLGVDSGIAAPESEARTILVLGDGRVYTGPTASLDIDNLVTSPILTESDLGGLRRQGVRYVVIDRRKRGNDDELGYAFSVHPPGGERDQLLPAAVATKFDDLPAPRIYDSGDVEVYDLGSVR